MLRAGLLRSAPHAAAQPASAPWQAVGQSAPPALHEGRGAHAPHDAHVRRPFCPDAIQGVQLKARGQLAGAAGPHMPRRPACMGPAGLPWGCPTCCVHVPMFPCLAGAAGPHMPRRRALRGRRARAGCGRQLRGRPASRRLHGACICPTCAPAAWRRDVHARMLACMPIAHGLCMSCSVVSNASIERGRGASQFACAAGVRAPHRAGVHPLSTNPCSCPARTLRPPPLQGALLLTWTRARLHAVARCMDGSCLPPFSRS